MKVQLDAAVIQNALRIVGRLAPPISGAVTLEAADGKLYMHSNSDTARCRVVLPASVKGKAFFAVGMDQLAAATKGRSELECEFDKTMFRIQSGNYKIDITTVDAIPLDEEAEDKGETWKVSAEHAAWLKSAVAAVAIKPTAQTATYMPVAIKLTDKAAFVACYDGFHMAFANDKDIQGKLDVTLPLETLNAVLDVVHQSSFKMKVGQATLSISNSTTQVSISLPETDDQEGGVMDTSTVAEKARQVVKADGHEVIAARDDILAFLDNARAVATKDRSEIVAKVEKGKMRFAITTTNGTAKASVKVQCKKDLEFRIDLDYFDEAIRKCGAEVQMKVVGAVFISFKTKSTYILVGQNAEK